MPPRKFGPSPCALLGVDGDNGIVFSEIPMGGRGGPTKETLYQQHKLWNFVGWESDMERVWLSAWMAHAFENQIEKACVRAEICVMARRVIKIKK